MDTQLSCKILCLLLIVGLSYLKLINHDCLNADGELSKHLSVFGLAEILTVSTDTGRNS